MMLCRRLTLELSVLQYCRRLTGIGIGRHRDMEIHVSDAWVSRFHCEIDQINGTVYVRDLGSKHGVFVNGFHVSRAQVMPGDRLTVGMRASGSVMNGRPKALQCLSLAARQGCSGLRGTKRRIWTPEVRCGRGKLPAGNVGASSLRSVSVLP